MSKSIKLSTSPQRCRCLQLKAPAREPGLSDICPASRLCFELPCIVKAKPLSELLAANPSVVVSGVLSSTPNGSEPWHIHDPAPYRDLTRGPHEIPLSSCFWLIQSHSLTCWIPVTPNIDFFTGIPIFSSSKFPILVHAVMELKRN